MITTLDSQQQTTVRIKRRFGASTECVFDAWLDPQTASKWLFVTTTGQSQCVEIDARPGGWFYFVERQDREDVDHIGEYLEVDPPRRLVFTLLAEKFERVSVLLLPFGSGCELDLTHETSPALASTVRRRWIEMFDRLTAMMNESGRDVTQSHFSSFAPKET